MHLKHSNQVEFILSLVILTLLACSDNSPPDAHIKIRLDTQTPGSGCKSDSCSDFVMTCGATVSIRITDPTSGTQLFRKSGEPLAMCLAIPPSDTLCRIKEYSSNMQIFGIPAQTVRMEVAIWNGEEVSVEACPAPSLFELFDPQGRPQPNFLPQPAFAGAVYFEAGRVDEVTVPLACPNSEHLGNNTCAANLSASVKASVTSLETLQPIRKEAAVKVTVSVGVPRKNTDVLGESFFELEANDTLELHLENQEISPLYRAQIPSRLGTIACTTTLTGTPDSTSTVFCQEVNDRAAFLSLSPLTIRKKTLDTIREKLEIESFPEKGIIIGRVVDRDFLPIEGTRISPQQGTVIYLDEDLNATLATQTSGSGYFVSLDVPYNTTWTAFHFDGRRQLGYPRAGLIQRKVSAIIIQIENKAKL